MPDGKPFFAARPGVMNCRYCGKFTTFGVRKSHGRKKHCNSTCYGLAQRGKSRSDRTSPSRKEYIQIRHEDGTREYLHRFIYRQENGEIPEGMIVHHRNENKRVNDPENLGLMKQNEHTPNAHYHWRTRDYTDGGYVPADPNDPNFVTSFPDDMPF